MEFKDESEFLEASRRIQDNIAKVRERINILKIETKASEDEELKSRQHVKDELLQKIHPSKCSEKKLKVGSEKITISNEPSGSEKKYSRNIPESSTIKGSIFRNKVRSGVIDEADRSGSTVVTIIGAEVNSSNDRDTNPSLLNEGPIHGRANDVGNYEKSAEECKVDSVNDQISISSKLTRPDIRIANKELEQCSNEGSSQAKPTKEQEVAEVEVMRSSNKRARTRRGTQRKNKKESNQINEEITEETSNSKDSATIPPIHFPTNFKLDAEGVLVLKLLMQSDDERHNSIIKLAKEHSILINQNDTAFFHPCLPKYYGALTKSQQNAIAKNLLPIIKPKSNCKPYSCQIKELVMMESKSAPQYGGAAGDIDLPQNVSALEKYAQKLIASNCGEMYEGEILVNAFNSEESFIRYKEYDVFFRSIMLRKRAMHGDIVRAFIFKTPRPRYVPKLRTTSKTKDEDQIDENNDESVINGNGDQPMGEEDKVSKARNVYHGFVIKITDPLGQRKIIASPLPSHKFYYDILFKPRDRKVPLINVPIEEFDRVNLEPSVDMLYLIEIIKWDNRTPIGRIIQEFGVSGQLPVEDKAILMKHDLQVDVYSEDILKKALENMENFTIPQEEYEKRTVLTDQCVFTIDPITARDLDDALSCRKLPNGNYEIGVHISDVTYFIEEFDDIDMIARRQATTIYMINSVYHMLPKSLCEQCSLLPGSDKLTFSVFWEMTPTADIISTNFKRSIIKSCGQFAYEHVQDMLNNPSKVDFDPDIFPCPSDGYSLATISKICNQLNAIAVQLRTRRYNNGAISIQKQKFSFDIDKETGRPIAIVLSDLGESNFLIEEFMLLANQSVAKFIHECYPNIALLRHHSAPDDQSMIELNEKLYVNGWKIDATSSKSVAESLKRIIDDNIESTSVSCIINYMLARQMVRAKYFCAEGHSDESLWHYALNIPIYTHFTSPIRRYADIVVHRLLAAAMNISPVPKCTPDEVASIAKISNDKKYSAKLAGEDSADLYFIAYLDLIGTIQMRAAILCIGKDSMEVIIEKTGHRIIIRYKTEKKFNIKFNDKPNLSITVDLIVEGDNPDIHVFDLKMCSELDVDVYSTKGNIAASISHYQPELNERISSTTVAS